MSLATAASLSKPLKIKALITLSVSLLASTASLAGCPVSLDGDTIGCAADRPCFAAATQNCHQVYFDFRQNRAWDFFNVRLSVNGGPENQQENRSGVYTIDNAPPSTRYQLKVQGCNSRPLQSSQCTPWSVASVTTVGDFGPATCRNGYVWRDARPNDVVCVKPADRDRVASDNAQAASRRQPGGGQFGADTCKEGFVWREAFNGDHVCVTPDQREIAQCQNRDAATHKLCR